MPFLHERLENGLDIVAETSPAAHSASVGFFVRAGARDETDATAGVSHFLEHMAFKGTEDLSGDEINRRFDALGASHNAFTAEEDTVYYAAVLPERQHEALELLAGMMRPALREEDFETEKLVILEEIRMYDDQPPYGADDRCRSLHFGSHPLGRSVLGTAESIGPLPVAAMRRYHHDRYAPGNLVLAASGAVDFAALVASARRLCDDWEPTPTSPRRATPAEALAPGREAIVRPQAVLEYVVRMSSGPSESHDDRFAAKLLAVALGDDSGSRLYWGLVDTGEADHASLSHHDFFDSGLFTTQLSCEPEDTATLLARIVEIYAEATDRGLTHREVEQARNKLAGRVVLAGERPRQRLFSIGLEWTHSGRYRSVADDLETLERLTADDLARVLGNWRLAGPAATVLAGPLPISNA